MVYLSVAGMYEAVWNSRIVAESFPPNVWLEKIQYASVHTTFIDYYVIFTNQMQRKYAVCTQTCNYLTNRVLRPICTQNKL